MAIVVVILTFLTPADLNTSHRQMLADWLGYMKEMSIHFRFEELQSKRLRPVV
jgi:hypothetical protein